MRTSKYRGYAAARRRPISQWQAEKIMRLYFPGITHTWLPGHNEMCALPGPARLIGEFVMPFSRWSIKFQPRRRDARPICKQLERRELVSSAQAASNPLTAARQGSFPQISPIMVMPQWNYYTDDTSMCAWPRRQAAPKGVGDPGGDIGRAERDPGLVYIRFSRNPALFFGWLARDFFRGLERPLRFSGIID